MGMASSKRGWKPLIVTALVVAVLLPSFYVLSSGPLLALYDYGLLPFAVVKAYQPLIRLAVCHEWSKRVLAEYHLWCRRRMGDMTGRRLLNGL
jgi:hypothetical protein